MEKVDTKNLGLALGSGAAFGLAHIGVLKVLEQEKIPVDIISGSSIGALIASMWGIGLSSDEIARITERLSRKLNIMRLLDFTAPISGILGGKRLKRFLRSILGEKTFEDLKIPVKIMVYDLANRETIALDEGLLLDAVYKSIAVPGIFAPIKEGARMIIDGGVSEPLPVDVLIANGAKKIIAVNVLPSPMDVRERNAMLEKIAKKEEDLIEKGPFYKKQWVLAKRYLRKIFTPNIFDVIVTTMQSMEYCLAENSSLKADVRLHPVLKEATSIDFHLAKRFAKRGEEETRAHIAQIRKLVV